MTKKYILSFIFLLFALSSCITVIIPAPTDPPKSASPGPQLQSNSPTLVILPSQTDTSIATNLAPKPSTDTIDWSQADKYIGQQKTVCGPVIGIRYVPTSNGQPTFLNVGRNYPDPKRFSILIWGENRVNFPSAPEVLYANKNICVTGTIASYQGSLEMQVTHPSNVQIK